MHALKVAIGVAWLVFWVYWLAWAVTSKASVGGGWRSPADRRRRDRGGS